ncbi:MAG: hypothetical protein NC293_10125 [Roseburia sp.]|nr:hypothetical protein [Roseburia sp.]
MAYTSYEFYKEAYKGDSVPEDVFDKWRREAEIVVNRYTFNRLRKAYPEDGYSDEMIQSAVCRIAENLYETDRYQRASALSDTGESTGIIRSKSAGSESITYASGESVYENVIKDPERMEKWHRSILAGYLSNITDRTGTCLLYAGMR